MNDQAWIARSDEPRRRASSAAQRSASSDASEPSTPTTIALAIASDYLGAGRVR